MCLRDPRKVVRPWNSAFCDGRGALACQGRLVGSFVSRAARFGAAVVSLGCHSTRCNRFRFENDSVGFVPVRMLVVLSALSFTFSYDLVRDCRGLQFDHDALSETGIEAYLTLVLSSHGGGALRKVT